MTDNFILPISFQDEELEFPARLLQFGFTFKIEVEVNGVKWLFERDEERNWRAGLPFEQANMQVKIREGLLEAIAGKIEEIAG